MLLATLGLVAAWLAPTSRSTPAARTLEQLFSGDGHGDAARAAVFSPDGRLLVIAGHASSSVWELASKRALFHVPATLLSRYQFSPDSSRLVATGESTRVHDARTGGLLYEHPGEAIAATFSPTGDRVLIRGQAVDLWEPTQDRVLRLHTHIPYDATWSPDGAQIAVASFDGVVEVFDARTGTLVASLPHDDTVNHVWWYAQDALITATNRHLRRWETARFREQTDIALPSFVSNIDVTRDSRRAAVKLERREGVDDGVRVFDLATGVVVRVLDDVLARQVQFDDSGRRLATSHEGVRVWDVETGALVRSLPGEIEIAWLSPDGSRLASVVGWPPTQLWDVATGERVALLGGHTGAITSIAFTPDGRYFAGATTRGFETDVKLWRRDDATLVAVYPHAAPVTRLVLSADGSELATGDRQGSVTIWSTVTHARLRTFPRAQTCAITGLDRNAETLVAASCDGKALVWNARTGEPRHELNAGYPLSAARLTPDGMAVITAGTRGAAALITLWDVRTGTARTTLDAGTRCSPALDVAPDGRSFLTACGATVRVWDLPAGTPRHELATDGAEVVAASYAGSELLTASRDGIARRFDTATGVRWASLRGDPEGFEIAAARLAVDDADPIVVTASRYTGELIAWRGATPVATTAAKQGLVHTVVADPFEPGRFFTIGEDTAGTLRVWRLR